MKNFKQNFFFIYGSLAVSAVLTSMLFNNCAQNSFESAQNLGDPLFDYSWHLRNTGQLVFASTPGVAGVDLNLAKTWNAGISGRGVRILVSDDGIEDSHQDLRANYLYGNFSKDYSKPYPYLEQTSAPKGNDDNHGTAVAGLIAATASNGAGSKGVAFGAKVVSANFLSSATSMTEASYVDQAGGDYDIFNMSWGSDQNTLVPILTNFEAKLRSGSLTGRGGKGSLYVKSAGNDFEVLCNGSTSAKCIGNSNFDGDNTSPFMIVVAALNSTGNAATYSSGGANLWISSFGGEFGDDWAGMFTTDRMGCSAGRSQTTTTGTSVAFEKGGNGNTDCNYSVTFNGTSSAAPVLSGVIALILEANPNLSWRDVKYILAKTAFPPFYPSTGNISHPLGEAMPNDAIWERKWITNAADFKFHNWYGFGRVDVDAAITMAKNSYVSPFSSYVETNFSANMDSGTFAIPDNSNTGVERTLVVSTSITKLESVQIRISVTHASVDQLGVEITSPGDTKSYVTNMNNSLRGRANFDNVIFLSNAFYQENPNGTWRVKVLDGSAGTTGDLTQWSLRFSGSDN